MSQKAYRFLMFLALLMIPLGIMATTNTIDPAEWHTIPSLFFKSWVTNAPVPVMATDGHRLPVEMSTSVSIGTVPVSITTQFVATDSANRYSINVASVSVSSVPAKITNWNEMPVYPFATDSSNQLKMNIASVSVSSMPVKITNFDDMPFAPTVVYATDTDERLAINISSYSTVIPASITNFPATTQLVTNGDNELLVAISSQSAVLVASISNLPATQQLKVDTDSNLTVNLASFTASMSVGVTNLLNDTPGNILVNIASITASGSTLYTDSAGNLYVNLASNTIGTLNTNVINLASDSSGRLKMSLDAIGTSTALNVYQTNNPSYATDSSNRIKIVVDSIGTSTPLIASISNLPAVQTFVVDASGSLAVNLASSVAVVAVQIDPTVGYLTVGAASRTITLPSAGTSVNLGAYIPAAAKIVKFTSFNGACIINSADDLATGTMYCGDYVASGSYLKYDGLAAGTRSFYGASNDSGATVTLKMVCY